METIVKMLLCFTLFFLGVATKNRVSKKRIDEYYVSCLEEGKTDCKEFKNKTYKILKIKNG